MSSARFFLPVTRDQLMTLNAYLMTGDAVPRVYGYSPAGSCLFILSHTSIAQESPYLVIGPLGTLNVDLTTVVLRVLRRDGTLVDLATWRASDVIFEIADAGVVLVRCLGLDDTLAAATGQGFRVDVASSSTRGGVNRCSRSSLPMKDGTCPGCFPKECPDGFVAADFDIDKVRGLVRETRDALVAVTLTGLTMPKRSEEN